MATTERRPLENLYLPEHPRRPHRRGVIDDTLDAYPPYHLIRGKPTPEAMEAAKRIAAERGYPPPQFLPKTQDDQDAPASASSVNGALAERPKRSAASGRARKNK